MFLDLIQKRALSRSMQLEAVYLEALLYLYLFNPQIWTKTIYLQHHLNMPLLSI